MRVITYGRRGGKTMWLISLVKQDPDGILVCINHAEIHRLMQEYSDIPSGRFVTVQEIREGKLRGLRPEPNLYVDNADMILSTYLGGHITAISVTSDV